MVLTLEEALPASALIYLFELEPTKKSAIYLAKVLSESIIDDETYARETCRAISTIHVNLAKQQCNGQKKTTQILPLPWISRSGMKVPSEVFCSGENLLPLYVAVDKDHTSESEAAAQLLYTLKLRASNHFSGKKFDFEEINLNFKIGFPLLLNYAESSTFATTGDFFLHNIVKMHLSAVNTIFSQKRPPYRILSKTLADHSNDVLRPYIDTSISEQLQKACLNNSANPDNVVLFVILCTLAVEMEKKPELKLLFNAEILNRENKDVALPFLFVDFPVRCLRGCRDAYGYVRGTTLVVGNGIGVIKTFLGWLEESKEELPNVHEVFLNKTLSSGNILHKFAL